MTINRSIMFDGTTTGITDEDSAIVKYGSRANVQQRPPFELIPVMYKCSHTGGAATLTPYLCVNPDDSPRAWLAVKNLQGDGTDIAVTRTASFNLIIDAPSGSLVKWAITGSGSPLPAVKMVAEGYAHGSA